MVPPAMWSEIAAIYRATKKSHDINWFTEWLCRPPAAIFVYFLRNTRITPNQVSFLSLIVCVGACAMWITLPDWWGALAAAAVYQLSFILDAVDGQLARVRKQTSVLGHLLDFLLDEIKAFLVFGTIAVRLWYWEGEIYYLVVGIGGLAALASGIAITSFMRRPEYGAKQPTAEGQQVELRQRTGAIGKAIGLFERAARFVVHYPQYIWICAIFDRMDIYLWAYGGTNVVYLGYTMLILLVKLGRFGPPAGAPHAE